MDSQEKTKTEFLKVSKFQSLKVKILVFALLATVVPSLVLGWISYLQSSKLLREKLAHELHNATLQVSDKLDRWMEDRLYDLRVFSSSYIVTENMTSLDSKERPTIAVRAARKRIKDYLQSVGERFIVYEELVLIDPSGIPVAASSDKPAANSLPEPWLAQIQQELAKNSNNPFPVHVDDENMFIAETVRASDGRTFGVLAAKINLKAIRSILIRQTIGGIDEVYLVGRTGRLLVSSKTGSSEPLDIPQHIEASSSISPHYPKQPKEYIGHHNRAVVGTAVAISSMNWVMVAEMEKKEAYAEIFMLRRLTMLVVSGLMVSIGIPAYIFGKRLVRPVQRLSDEATQVAAGNLDVDIPVVGLSEVSYLTQVFNHMVDSLRHNREDLSAANKALHETNEELHQTSITDSLTGLYNRKHIMELLEREISRSKRSGPRLSVLMLDIDYFKKVNDTYGHQVGDNVMTQLAETLGESVREYDFVGRYGGEEFLVILPDSDIDVASITAERIRKNVANLKFIENSETFSVTISIGVAEYPVNGEGALAILRQADNALYQAKGNGRNRVVISEKEKGAGVATLHVLSERRRRANGAATTQ